MQPPPMPHQPSSFDAGSSAPPFKRARSDNNKDTKKELPGNNGAPPGTNGRQSFSCAECKRLKLKCSREWPCTSCTKRGCAQICPSGEMRTGKGKRLILADTEELHQRISLLEVALAQSHAKHSTSPHPLLASPYLYHMREPPAKPVVEEASVEGDGGPEDIVGGGLGTLTISKEGEARFVGSFAGSEYLREEEDGAKGDQAGSGQQATDNTAGRPQRSQRDGNDVGLVTPPATAHQTVISQDAPDLTSDGQGLTDLLLGGIFASGDSKQSMNLLRQQLPEWDTEGRLLAASYWENVNWMYQILPRPMFDGDHLLNAYDTASPPNAHKIACVFLVMAVGVMFDLNRGPFDPRGEELFELGKACIAAVGLEHASPATVQALHLCGTYIMNDKHGNGGEVFWPITGVAIKVAQRLGLHRDGAAFGLSSYEVEERRQVWWEIVTYERLQALCFGRPCSSSNKSSDTLFPDPEEGLCVDSDGYHRSKYQLVVLMEKVIELQTQTTPVSIKQVTQVDKEFREFKKTIPESLMPGVPTQSLPFDRMYHPHVVIHRLGIRLLVAQCRLLLNRPAFARALKDNPEDPSGGKFGDSFVALYESAQDIVQIVKMLVIYHPSLIARFWFYWFHHLTSAVCLAAIAIRAPTSAFAGPAYQGMSIACDISAAARPGCRAKKGLPTLLRLRKRANAVLEAVQRTAKGKRPPEGRDSVSDDDLEHLSASGKLRRIGGDSPRTNTLSPKSNVRPMTSPNLPSVPTLSPNETSPPFAGPTVQTKKRQLSDVGGRRTGVRANGQNRARAGTQTSAYSLSGIDESPTFAGDSNPSPRSARSIATSATLAEPIHYDTNGNWPTDQPFSVAGAVQAPPPMSGQAQETSAPPDWFIPHQSSSTGQRPGSSNGSMLNGTSNPFDLPWSPDQEGTGSSQMFGYESSGNAEFDWNSLTGNPEMASVPIDMDMSMALVGASWDRVPRTTFGASGSAVEIDGSSLDTRHAAQEGGGLGVGYLGNGDEFDFELFVNQMGVDMLES